MSNAPVSKEKERPANVLELQAYRQRRMARRMAMQAIALQYAYPAVYRFIAVV